jgi:hypothetical protein
MTTATLRGLPWSSPSAYLAGPPKIRLFSQSASSSARIEQSVKVPQAYGWRSTNHSRERN